MKNIKIKLLHATPLFLLKSKLEIPYDKEINGDNWKEVARKILVGRKHESVGEEIDFHWEIDGFSRLNLQEWVRHRIASPTVRSTRFTLNKFFDWAEKQRGLMFENDDDIERVEQEFIKNFFVEPLDFPYTEEEKEAMAYSMYVMGKTRQKLQELGWSTRQINDRIKYLLPESFRVKMQWKCNWRSLCNFLKMRKGDKNNTPHPEIKYCAETMLNILRSTEYAFLFEHL